MIVEVLFSEFYTYGEIENVRYLAKMLRVLTLFIQAMIMNRIL